MMKIPLGGFSRIFSLLLLWGTLIPATAHAYIEPGLAALLWQVVIAGLLGAVMFIRKIRLYSSLTITWLWRTFMQRTAGTIAQEKKQPETTLGEA